MVRDFVRITSDSAEDFDRKVKEWLQANPRAFIVQSALATCFEPKDGRLVYTYTIISTIME